MRSFKRLHCGRRDGAKSRKQRLLPCFDRSGGSCPCHAGPAAGDARCATTMARR